MCMGQLQACTAWKEHNFEWVSNEECRFLYLHPGERSQPLTPSLRLQCILDIKASSKVHLCDNRGCVTKLEQFMRVKELRKLWYEYSWKTSFSCQLRVLKNNDGWKATIAALCVSFLFLLYVDECCADSFDPRWEHRLSILHPAFFFLITDAYY